MSRHKDINWNVGGQTTNGMISGADGKLATMMDIRDELQKLNALLHCHNTMAIPELLRAIKRNTTKPKRKPKP